MYSTEDSYLLFFLHTYSYILLKEFDFQPFSNNNDNNKHKKNININFKKIFVIINYNSFCHIIFFT